MSVLSKKELDIHRYHDVTLKVYMVEGIALKCIDCNEILLEFHDDKYGMIQLDVHSELFDNINEDVAQR